jgi:hypothetical protein
MAAEVLKCLRCGADTAFDDNVYFLTHARNKPSGGMETITDKGRMLRLFRCTNDDCRTVELKAAKGWPV